MKRTTTEYFDEDGRLTERVVEEEYDPSPIGDTATVSPYIGDPLGGWYPGVIDPNTWQYYTSLATSCPCNPANGGSGVCNCILGGVQVSCSVES